MLVKNSNTYMYIKHMKLWSEKEALDTIDAIKAARHELKMYWWAQIWFGTDGWSRITTPNALPSVHVQKKEKRKEIELVS